MARDLHVTSPPLTGEDVLILQRRLIELGYDPGPCDGVYGVASASAVRTFQRDRRLAWDGIVGAKTRTALGSARRTKPRASKIGLRALAEALSQLGVSEQPAGSNRTPFGEWLGVDGVPWCNTFVSYAFAVGAGYVICADFPGAGVTTRGCTYVPTTEAWLRASGMWRGRISPLAGDIVILNVHGEASDHIGIVEEPQGGEIFQTVEGNSSLTGAESTGAVRRRTRSLEQTVGFGRVPR